MKWSIPSIYAASMVAVLAYAPSSYAGSGHVNKVVEVQAPEGISVISRDAGSTIVKVAPSVSSEKEFGLFVKARAFLIEQFGEDARDWPLTIDPKNQTFSFLNASAKKMTLRFAETEE